MATTPDFTVETLGEAKIPSPITYSTVRGDAIANYVRDDERILYDIEAEALVASWPVGEGKGDVLFQLEALAPERWV